MLKHTDGPISPFSWYIFSTIILDNFDVFGILDISLDFKNDLKVKAEEQSTLSLHFNMFRSH